MVTSVLQSSLKLHLNVYAYIIYLQTETKGNGYNVNNVEAVVTYKVEWMSALYKSTRKIKAAYNNQSTNGIYQRITARK